MTNITNDKLVWIYTNYGLRRITEVMNNPDSKLSITKMIVGDSEEIRYDAETGLPIYTHDYYTPLPTQTNLKNPKASFFFHSKELDEANSVVTFITDIPEDSGGYLINEIGLYEDGSLLAICTCQSLAKPSIDDNYLMSISFRLALHSYNLSSIYDRIILNADSEYLQPKDLETVQYSILYMEGNLIEQISENSHIIGLNKARDLEQLIEANRKTTATSLLTNIYSSMGNLVGFENVKNFWTFDYSRNVGTINSILDMGYNGEFLNTDKDTSEEIITYEGVCPCLPLDDNDFYSEISTKDDGLTTWFFVMKHTSMDENAIILAKSDYQNDKHEFEFLRHKNRSLEIKLFTSDTGYISFTSDINIIPETAYALAIQIPENYIDNNILVMINGNIIELEREVFGTLGTINRTTIGYTSYLNQLGSTEKKYRNNSTMGLMIKLISELTIAEIRGLSLALTALGGTNICMNFR